MLALEKALQAREHASARQRNDFLEMRNKDICNILPDVDCKLHLVHLVIVCQCGMHIGQLEQLHA